MKRTKKTVIAIIWVTFLFPILFLLMLAFSETWRFPALFPDQFSTHQASQFFAGSGQLNASLMNSLIISFSVSFISVIFAFFISKKIAYHRSKQFFTLLAYLPFVLSPVIYAASLNYFFILAGLSGTMQGVMIAQFIIVFPYNVILFLSHWNSELRSYEQLVKTLGGSSWAAFTKAVVPLSLNILLIAFFQSFIISWFEFGLTNFIGLGQVQTLTVKVFPYISESNIHLAAFSSLLLVIPPLILLWLNKRFVFHEY